MSPKSNKSLLSLTTCEKCQCAFGQKDATLHESNCPPSFENWNHNFIINNTLHSTLEIYNAPGIYIIDMLIFYNFMLLSYTLFYSADEYIRKRLE